eukprot:TRINITY_DN5775_c0_g1_i6.p2 TRINITY_DN5775_c0_g1~~TRINITY_DN5775_c0_g1_i6.p2  ORF type:complete len:141 (+),score=25.18 TRINITY_DN5775_c0_g1_i6:216-638(+)
MTGSATALRRSHQHQVSLHPQCWLDECVNSPCGQGQTCNDPDQLSPNDYTCTCLNGVSATGGVATCSVDDCEARPCGDNQRCEDPNTGADSRNDFVCTCIGSPVHAIGASVDQCPTPAPEVPVECEAAPTWSGSCSLISE